ncbi:MAG: esterase-like activity of phytase family protein [Opitutaceae bacterium]|nr:esterase-like activity of phytase family protein [Opitutaceae bacterium]
MASLRLFHARLAASLVFLAPLGAQTPVAAGLNGHYYVNHGLVGVGRIPAATRDKFGETLGSFSALAVDAKSWRRNADGTYAGTFYMQPDRGYNNPGTTNWRARFFTLSIAFAPAPAGAVVQNQVGITVADTTLLTEANGTPLTALDTAAGAAGVRAAAGGLPPLPQAFNGRLSIDAEGIARLPDGSFYVSDEYGPYIFKFSATGVLQSAIRPPAAIVPQRNGADSFASNNPAPGQPAPVPVDPTVGRQNNQGLEGLSLSPDGRTLFALLQSATRQDGGTGGASLTRFNARLLAYDITGAIPALRGEYVLQLPTTRTAAGATLVCAQSEILAISNTQILVLARDAGFGRTYPIPTATYRKILVYDIAGATNIAGTRFDDPANPIAPGGVLDSSIRPALRAEFIDINDSAQLAKFGLRNGPTDDANNLSEKWEAMALVPALDPAAPNDWFLFVGNDNDFITQSGLQDGVAYAHPSGAENDSMLLVYRLTLPGRINNLSSRAQTGTGAAAQIVGFVVSGPRPKPLLVRGVGPTLTSYGVTGALADPVLTIFNAAGQGIYSNDNWGDAANAADLRAAAQASGAFALTEGSRDSALLVQLDPGAYTAQVAGVGGTTGISLVEIYEAP